MTLKKFFNLLAMVLAASSLSGCSDTMITDAELKLIQVDPKDFDEVCDRSGIIVMDCKYSGTGPLGLSIGMDADALRKIVRILVESRNHSISLKQIIPPRGWRGRLIRPGAKIEDIEKGLYWADKFTVPYQRNNKKGFLTVELEKGTVVSLEWSWSLGMP